MKIIQQTKNLRKTRPSFSLLCLIVLAFSFLAVAAEENTGSDDDLVLDESTAGSALLRHSGASDVNGALRENRDIWGEALIAAGGATAETIAPYLPPLLYSTGKVNTVWGMHHILYAADGGEGGCIVAVADGSRLAADAYESSTELTLAVGKDGEEVYGSHLERLEGPTLVGGWYPQLQSAYTDAEGNRYEQESCALFLPGQDSLSALIQLHIVPKASASVCWRVGEGDNTHAAASHQLEYDESCFRAQVQEKTRLYLLWSPRGTVPADLALNKEFYEASRASWIAYWESALGRGVQFQVPEKLVMDCQRNLLIQNLMLRWRYSMGAVVYNQSWYQPESSDAMSLLTMYGYPQEARAGLTTLLHKTKGAGFYTNWEAGEKLSHGAEYYFLTRDNTFLEEHLDAHTALCETFAKQIQEDPKGLLEKQRHCGDIPDVDYCTFHQAVGWQGLRHMASAWQLAGFSEVADTYAAVADQLRESLLQAIELSSTGLADGTLFVPSILYGEEKEVYSPITKTRMGSYWNLCMPYAFATGLWPFDSAELTAISDFMHGHGATLLGLLRFNYYPVEIGSYKADGLPGYWSSGVDNVYLPSYQRMLAQRDDAERLILSFYGKLMHGQTRGTFVSGEGDTLGPYPGLEYRSSYGAVCSANNTAFLLPLRLMLVRESTDPATGIPEGLHLAHATPRQWLEAGKEIRVEEAPTAFGLVSFTLKAKSDGSAIEISIKTPERNMPEQLRLKLRLPQGKKIKAVRNNQQSKSIETDAPVSFDAETEIIHLDGLQGNIQLTALLD